ncbi:Exocyst complex component EXO70B1 [Bienertia sinuspersici]
MASNPPVKCLSFDSRYQDENKNKDEKEIGKSFSFGGSRSSSDFSNDNDPKLRKPFTIDEETEHDDEEASKEYTLDQLSDDVHQFILSLASSSKDEPPEISNVVAKFLKKVESKIEEYESTAQDSVVFGRDVEGDASFIAAVNRLSGLLEAIQGLKSNYTMPLLNQTSSVLHRVMVFLEEELRLILEESACNKNSNNATESEDQQEGKEVVTTFPFFSSESISSIRLIANAMITAGYEPECCNVFLLTRRHTFEEELKKQGLDKISADDVQKMNWEPLEGEISTWIRVFKNCTSTLLPGEEAFYESVLDDHISTRQFLYSDISYAILSILVNFAEAISMTKRATEKLFKFLDMYETLRDTVPWVESKTNMYTSEESKKELKSELSFAKSRLGEAAVSIFCQLENSIKGDNTKTPVASGAVHPLTRYTMNYLKYACEYKDTLEQVFQQHLRTELTEEYSHNIVDHHHQHHHNKEEIKHSHSPFAAQLITIMDLLDSYLESKSKLYKDPSLRSIFLMNNGRYMLQKVKGSTEIHQVVGDNWCRKRSSDVRHHHKNYQRETWSKVLQCLNQEGLQVNGKVHKPILKERFKNFNQYFDEIHKTQSNWVVCDEQLQSELRVSISAVMIPAYRSFVARFGQIFTPGRQVEKYIKFQPDDIETIIEELFDGNASSMPRRKT